MALISESIYLGKGRTSPRSGPIQYALYLLSGKLKKNSTRDSGSWPKRWHVSGLISTIHIAGLSAVKTFEAPRRTSSSAPSTSHLTKVGAVKPTCCKKLSRVL